MTEDEPRTPEDADSDPRPMSRTGAEKGAPGAPKERKDSLEMADEVEAADKTDMSAVGDDGQVFGG